MSEGLVLIHDREVLRRTLWEIFSLMENRSTLSSLRARVRVLWLLQTLCASTLSRSEVSSLQDATRAIQDQIQRAHRATGSASTLDSIFPSS